MGRSRVRQQRLYPSRAAECTSAAAGLKRLTRAELIAIIAKLERQASSSDRDECVADKAVSRPAPTMLLNESVRSGQRLTFEEGTSSSSALLVPGPKLWLADLSTSTAPCGAGLMQAHPINLVRAYSVKSLRRNWLRLGASLGCPTI